MRGNRASAPPPRRPAAQCPPAARTPPRAGVPSHARAPPSSSPSVPPVGSLSVGGPPVGEEDLESLFQLNCLPPLFLSPELSLLPSRLPHSDHSFLSQKPCGEISGCLVICFPITLISALWGDTRAWKTALVHPRRCVHVASALKGPRKTLVPNCRRTAGTSGHIPQGGCHQDRQSAPKWRKIVFSFLCFPKVTFISPELLICPSLCLELEAGAGTESHPQVPES